MRSFEFAKRSTLLCVFAALSFAPSAFSAGRTPSAGVPSDEVTVILNDFSGATQSAATLNNAAEVAALSGSAVSHLISLTDEHHLDPGRHVKVAEPQAAFTWLIDLAGLGGLLFYLNRRRATPAPVNA